MTLITLMTSNQSHQGNQILLRLNGFCNYEFGQSFVLIRLTHFAYVSKLELQASAYS